jgi:uncharacterized membrane protein YeaQ/YmgE (transglycosylase-associated protein family)
MSLFPFLVLGLLNGIVVGLAAGLVARAIAPGDGPLRFRDAAFLGMLGSIGGSIVATIISSQDGYLTSGPSSLLFSVIGAALAIGAATYAQVSNRTPQRSRASRQS